MIERQQIYITSIQSHASIVYNLYLPSLSWREIGAVHIESGLPRVEEWWVLV